ncbi:hypothetical protein N7493_010287 [Penicillium malachiteum]|uniref:Uncharacterized protein n=1 Tax=Penicillium malachiteum TaxID=1324776 RepID=A0AAD6MRJ1_9EURO|nr:hypothetical protein N7493_010287 [Penicillium malachiteum]
MSKVETVNVQLASKRSTSVTSTDQRGRLSGRFGFFGLGGCLNPLRSIAITLLKILGTSGIDPSLLLDSGVYGDLLVSQPSPDVNKLPEVSLVLPWLIASKFRGKEDNLVDGQSGVVNDRGAQDISKHVVVLVLGEDTTLSKVHETGARDDRMYSLLDADEEFLVIGLANRGVGKELSHSALDDGLEGVEGALLDTRWLCSALRTSIAKLGLEGVKSGIGKLHENVQLLPDLGTIGLLCLLLD